jgi:DNA-directed RNA polymerase specialized sigma subunit
MASDQDKAMDPIDVALAAKEKLAEERRAEDTHLWKAWKSNPTPENMEPLMQRFAPLFRQKTQSWKAPNVNQAAFTTNLKIQAVDAFQTFDPNRGASLRTHLENRLQKAKRFNIKHQNYAYIPEEQAGHIGRIQVATDELTEDLGRTPTPQEIANQLNPSLSGRQLLTPQKVERIQQAQRKDIVGSTFESDPTPHAISREREVVSLLRPSLNQEQQQVYDHLYGHGGKPVITSTTQLAQVLGKSPSQISRLRTSILAKFDELK